MPGCDFDYSLSIMEPSLIAICQNCKKAECAGICIDYKNEFRRLRGLPPIKVQGHRAESTKPSSERKQNVLYECRGEWHTLREWSEITGIKYMTLYHRVHRFGMSMDQAVKKKVERRNTNRMVLTVGSVTMDVKSWAKDLGIGETTIYHRLQNGYSDYEALFGKGGQE